mmetsp:Transcript_12482/g.31691  ORF Transcript_12482/g.31691 Transcript_12482/m.31691 type:complete len:219 (+) Transcript_12482:859-1515(+)
MLVVGVEELGVHLDGLLEVEGVEVEHAVHRHLAALRPLDLGRGVDALEAFLDPGQVLLGHQVGLVEDQAVGECDLLDRLVLDSLWPRVVEVLLDVLRIDEGDDAVQPEVRLDGVVHEEGLRDGRGIRHAGGLDEDAVELEVAGEDAVGKLLEHDHQVLAHGATDAPVHHLHDLLLDLLLGVLRHQSVVDAHIAELVLDDCDLLAVLARQDVVHKGRLP